MTSNGQRIYDLINHSDEHPSAEEIYFQLKKEGKGMSMATVYNNLASLLQEGKIARVNMEDGPERYDKIWRHDHLLCAKCGKLCDVVLPDLSKQLSEALKTSILSYDLKINYICSECQKKEEENV